MSAHGGNLRQYAESAGRSVADILDFSANINPLGPPEWLRPVISASVSSVVHYPDPDCTTLVNAAAEHYGVAQDEVVVGNGSTELIYAIPRILDANRALIPVPAYADYARASRQAGLAVDTLALREHDGFAMDIATLEARIGASDLVFIGQPNNPTGRVVDSNELRSLAIRNPAAVFVVDEAFGDFVEGMDSLTENRPRNVIVLLSLTKFYAIPGLRLGCCVADANIVGRIRDLCLPWSVNAIAQAVGEAALKDINYAVQTRETVRELRDDLLARMDAIPGLTVYPGLANFVLARIDRHEINARQVAERMLQSGIAIRVCDDYEGLDSRFFRVAVRTHDENDRLCDLMKTVFGAANIPPRKQKTPAIMFQGTSSNAGKSVLAAALCRILLQDGHRVAPFKAQNMSLNSYVTRDGGEMGRAQVVQAQACRIDPDVRMNPVLLKPSSETGSQVILCGKPVGDMDFGAYSAVKRSGFDKVKECYDSLASEHDVMVLEGAGSPGEVNLKSRDIVNMRMARYAGAPVLLVGDIDRGGVYASFVGTMEVLAEWERALIAGFIVNRFRGTESLLSDAHDYVLRHTGRPVIGVVPYLRELGLPEEDSVSFKSGVFDETNPDGAVVEIALIDLPHISNFTDFDGLRIEPDVHLRIVRSASELGRPDAVIVPGSKNVVGDLAALRSTGLDGKILELAANRQAEIVGICGGFQILGKEIADPHHVESAGLTVPALGLIPGSTVLAREKTLTSVKAIHFGSGLRLYGYEIHHGVTDSCGSVPLIEREDGAIIGTSARDGLVWGTYLHGVFDADEFRRWFVDRLRVRRGLPAIGKVCAVYDLEPALDRLADVVRQSIDLDKVYRLMGLR